MPTSSTCGGTSWRARYDGLARARDLYQESLDLDSRFAPAWAHLGRCHRVIGKYVIPSPESEVARGGRPSAGRSSSIRICRSRTSSTRTWKPTSASAQRALVRLLNEANRHGNDPELFAGLVHACRYCGLFEESIAAHAEARRLDPNVPTSLEQTLLMAGDVDALHGVRAAGARCRAPTKASVSSHSDLQDVETRRAGRSFACAGRTFRRSSRGPSS